MIELRQSTARIIPVGSAMAVGDGFTPITTLDLSTADQAEILKANGATTVDISGYTFAAITDCDGWYHLTVAASGSDTLGEMKVVIQDESLSLPIEETCMVLTQNAWDSKYGTDKLQVDVVEVSGDGTAADNLEFQYDGTGLTGDNFPSSQAQVGQISTGSSAVSTTAGSAVITTGTETLDYTATIPLDGTTHDVVPDGGVLDYYYQFGVGAGSTASEIIWHGYVNTNNDVCTVWAWDWVGAAWSQIGTLDGTISSVIAPETFNLTTVHTGTGADAGKVRIRFASSGGAVITNISTDQILCSFAVTAVSVGYANGAIWLNTNKSNINSTPFVDGVADNPVSTLAAALSLSASVGLDKFEVSQGSSLALVSTSDGLDLAGLDWNLALGGQQVDGTTIIGAVVTGEATGNGGSLLFVDCRFGDVTLPEIAIIDSVLSGDIVANEAGFYFMKSCASGVAGTDTPSFDYGAALGATMLNVRDYSGGLEIKNMQGSDMMSIEGNGQLIINANCSGGTIAIRGNFTVTDNALGVVTLSDDARFDVTQVTNAVPTAAATATAVVDSVIEDNGQGDTWTLKGVLRALFAPLAGFRSGGGAIGAKTFGVPGSIPNKVRVTVPTDADGNSTGDSIIDVSDV